MYILVGCAVETQKKDSICYYSLKPLQYRQNGRDSVSNHQPHHCLLNRQFRRRSKKTSKLRVTGLCAGNSLGTGEFPAQMASNAKNVSIWWRHHAMNDCEVNATQIKLKSLTVFMIYLDRQIDRQRDRESYRQRQTDRQTDRRTEGRTDRRTDGRTDRQTDTNRDIFRNIISHTHTMIDISITLHLSPGRLNLINSWSDEYFVGRHYMCYSTTLPWSVND